MITVYKYPIQILDEQWVPLPRNAQILTVQTQAGEPFLWALVDTFQCTDSRKIHIRGTGHDAEGLGKYVSTFQMKGGELVFHVFEDICG